MFVRIQKRDLWCFVWEAASSCGSLWAVAPPILFMLVVYRLLAPLRVRRSLIISEEEGDRSSLLYPGWANPTQIIRPSRWWVSMTPSWVLAVYNVMYSGTWSLHVRTPDLFIGPVWTPNFWAGQSQSTCTPGFSIGPVWSPNFWAGSSRLFSSGSASSWLLGGGASPRVLLGSGSPRG